MGIENFIAFVLAALLFIMTPGIDTVFVLNRSIDQGRKSGAYAVLGVNTGVMVHTLFAALGLSIIIAQSAIAFTIIKYLGAIYLIYLGVMKLLSQKQTVTTKKESRGQMSGKKNFFSGLLTNTLNPKVALFFLAFFPQFISPQHIEDPTPFILLGLTYAGIGMVWFLILTMFAGGLSQKMKNNPKASLWFDKFSGLAFILMGIKIAFAKL
ncbi:MAG: LysE family translocator [Psychroflexus sp.]|nr:LysE family translocator [Psychroflexus sp.]MDN6309682.1 LysE family translocator [Psychroflexus sp.]